MNSHGCSHLQFGLDFELSADLFNPLLHPLYHTSLSNNNVASIHEDSKGMLWFGTNGGGLNRFHSPTKGFEHYKHEAVNAHSLGGDRIGTIFVDRSENIWVGTIDAGVSRADLKRRKFNTVGGEPSMVPAFIAADHAGNIWFGNDAPFTLSPTTYSVSRIAPDATNANQLGVRFVRHVYKDRSESLWFCTYGGLEYRDKNGKFLKHYTHDPANARTIGGKEVTFALEDRAGTFWVGLRNGGVDKFSRKRGEFVHYSPDGKPPEPRGVNAVIAMAEDSSGNLWIGRGDALYKLAIDRKTFTRYSFDASNPRSLSNNTAICLVVTPEGELWVGTGLGLNRYNAATDDFTRYTSAHGQEQTGIANDKIWALLADNHNAIWASSNRGLTKITFGEDGTARFRNYDNSDGLRSMEFNQNAAYKAQDGTMYFGNSEWLLWFHPDSVKDNPHMPQLVLTGFKKFDMPFDLDVNLSEVKEIRLAYEDNVFSFQFAALEFTNPAKNQYAYKMEGFESNWIYSGARREVRYTHLSPGEYVFRAKASNNDGVWNETELAIRVIVVPPFWRTWWFMTGSFFFAVTLIGGSIRYAELRRLKRKIELLEHEKAIERERTRISRNMHDDLGASLTKISVLSEIAKREMPETSTANETIRKISDTAREVVGNLDEIVWAVNPKNDTLDSLAAYIAEYAEQYFEPPHIKCRFDFPEVIPPLRLTSEVRHNTFLAIKEALHNILKYADATTVRIGLVSNDGSFHISIQDDGKGFSVENIAHFSNGIENMKKRIEEVGGKFEIQSELKMGTTVRIQFDLPA